MNPSFERPFLGILRGMDSFVAKERSSKEDYTRIFCIFVLFKTLSGRSLSVFRKQSPLS